VLFDALPFREKNHGGGTFWSKRVNIQRGKKQVAVVWLTDEPPVAKAAPAQDASQGGVRDDGQVV
jgi:hypothetical protein